MRSVDDIALNLSLRKSKREYAGVRHYVTAEWKLELTNNIAQIY